jgi:hypothetical protein
MFLLDSLMISGIRWALETVITAAEAEMNDDSALRDQLLEAEMRREMGEIDDEEFRELETSLLARIREIKERREGGGGPIAFGKNEPMDAGPGSTFQIEAEVSGDFHEPSATAPSAASPALPPAEPAPVADVRPTKRKAARTSARQIRASDIRASKAR